MFEWVTSDCSLSLMHPTSVQITQHSGNLWINNIIFGNMIPFKYSQYENYEMLSLSVLLSDGRTERG